MWADMRSKSTWPMMLGVIALVATTMGAPAEAARSRAEATSPSVVNGDFSDGLDGWTVSGDVSAVTVETGGVDGTGHRLNHWAAADYSVSTTQRVDGLSRGWWTVAVWIKAGGALDATTLSLTGCGLDDATTLPLTEQDDQWIRLAVSAYVAGGSCTIGITTSGPGGAWANVDDVTVTPGRVSHQVRGIDLSGLAKNEDLGAVYHDSSGQVADPVEVLEESGANLGRLKVWVDPADGYNDLEHVVATAKRIDAAGMDLLIDFHYSDRWADPGAQLTPAAWEGLTAVELADRVYDHTHQVLDALATEGITADYVQIGNEINPGMLWPWGQTWDVDPDDDVADAQWDNLALFLAAGARAVADVSGNTLVLLHLTNINWGVDAFTWWFDEITARDVDFDLIALSFYGYWHGSFADLQQTISVVSERYDKDVLVVETAYPFTLEDDPSAPWENIIDQPDELVIGYPATSQGQSAYLRAVFDAVASAPGGRGVGAVYWEPAWTAVDGAGWDPEDPASGNAWENQALFDFDGVVLPAADELAPAPAAPHFLRSSQVTARWRQHWWHPGSGGWLEVAVRATGHRPRGEVAVLLGGTELDRTDVARGRARLSVGDLPDGDNALIVRYSGSSTIGTSETSIVVPG
jgi:arabinogalactan endo-1,4-beta-galactosidase